MSSLNQTEQTIYDRLADQLWSPDSPFAPLSELNPARLNYFEQFVPSWRGKLVLDVGCAGGFTAEALAKQGAQVSAVDPASCAVAAAQRHAQQSQLDIDYRVAAAEALPYENNTFDAVVCVDVLEHVEDLDRAISEISRVLKPGGLLLFDTVNRTWLSFLVMIVLLERVLGEIPNGVHDWSSFIRPKELRQLCDTHGLRVDHLTGFWILGRTGSLRKLRVVTGGPTSVMYIGCAQLKSG